MKKLVNIIILFLLLTISFLILSSCSPKNNNDIIQIWMYDYNNNYAYTNAVNNIVVKLSSYCKSNNIPYEVVKYNEDTLAHKDYILKRNTAMAKGNMIIIDDLRNLQDIAMQHVDYTKLANYNNLISAYKDRFCIPVGVGYQAFAINNEAIKYYDINMESNVLSYFDYLKIIQQMKEKGAKFKLNKKIVEDIINYYMMKNNIRYLDEKSAILSNSENFKATIKKTFIEICEEFKLYYKDIENFDFLSQTNNELNYYVHDEISGLTIMSFEDAIGYNTYALANYSEVSNLKDKLLNTSFVVNDTIMYYSPCVYMYKKVTNDKIYDVFNQILSDSYFKLIISTFNIYSPVIDTEKTRNCMEVNENWEHNGLLKAQVREDDEKSLIVLNTVNDALKLLVKDKDKSKHLADTYYNNYDFYINIYNQLLILTRAYLLTDNFDYNIKEVDDMINEELDNFVLNFNVHYK